MKLSRVQLARLVRDGKLKQVSSASYSLPEISYKAGIKIDNEIYYSSSCSCQWYSSESKLLLNINYSYFDSSIEFPLNLRVLKSLESIQKSEIKKLNIKFRYMKRLGSLYYYKEYYLLLNKFMKGKHE